MKRPTPTRRRKSQAPAPAQAARTPSYDDLLAIVRLIESGSRFSDFRLRSGDIEVEIHRANGAAGSPSAAAETPTPTPPTESVAKPKTTGARVDLPAGAHVIESPMVGTFYRAPEPGAKPFVEPGARVKPDTIVCIIEVMKLMNSVAAGVHGVVERVLVENAHMVEYGQPLIAIRVNK